MAFEVNTLFLLTIDVEAILGLLLLLVWVQNTRVTAVAWWACAHLMRSASVMLYGLYGAVPDLISIDLSNVILFSAFGVTWNGARVFNGRAALPGSLMAGAVLWLFASLWPGFEAGAEARGQLSAMIIAVYIWLTAFEFWRGRSEPLVSRWPAIVLFATHGTMFLLRTPLNTLLHDKDADHLLANAWLSVLSLEAFLMTIATAFILLAMSKERTELRHKTAAMTDPLTGLLNRRGLDAYIGTLVGASEVNGVPLTLALIDVDLFKRINDTFSHSVGDTVLRRVSSVIRAHCRQDDLPVRYGGDEFLLVLAGADLATGTRVLQRLKRASDACLWQSEVPGLTVTLSIGIASHVRGATIAATIAAADEALYAAKAAGRDRIVAKS